MLTYADVSRLSRASKQFQQAAQHRSSQQAAEEEERQSLGHASTSSDVFPKVTVMKQLAGMTSRPLAN